MLSKKDVVRRALQSPCSEPFCVNRINDHLFSTSSSSSDMYWSRSILRKMLIEWDRCPANALFLSVVNCQLPAREDCSWLKCNPLGLANLRTRVWLCFSLCIVHYSTTLAWCLLQKKRRHCRSDSTSVIRYRLVLKTRISSGCRKRGKLPTSGITLTIVKA